MKRARGTPKPVSNLSSELPAKAAEKQALGSNTNGVIEAYSTITCPRCGNTQREEMPTDFCQFFYECHNCLSLLSPTSGDCCVYCSYGDVPCPSIQNSQSCCDQDITQ